MSIDSQFHGTLTLSPDNSQGRLSPNLRGQESMITLGEAKKTSNDRFMFQTLNNDSTMLNTLKETIDQTKLGVPASFVPDTRIKPTNLRRHKNSDFDTFLLKHANG